MNSATARLFARGTQRTGSPAFTSLVHSTSSVGYGGPSRARWLAVVVTSLLVQVPRLSAQSAPRVEAQKPHPPAWVVTGGVRQQYEHFTNEEWGAAPQDSNGYFLQRYMFRIDRRVAPWATAAIEIKSGIE